MFHLTETSNNQQFNYINCPQYCNINREEEIDYSTFFYSENKLFEIEINIQENLESIYYIKNSKIIQSNQNNNKKIFILKKENLEKFTNTHVKNNSNDIYRKDAYYKHFKSLFAKYLKNKANRLKNICFPHFSKNNLYALAYKYTGNVKERDNYNFLKYKIKEIFIYGKNAITKNRQYNNELIIKYIENNENAAKENFIYTELVDFLNDTVENELIKFYSNKKEFENLNKDPKCLFFDYHYKRETGISLLERYGFINCLKNKKK